MSIPCMILLSAVLATGACIDAAAQEPIKLAALFNRTGAMAAIDEPGYKGAALAVRVINSKGGLLRGRPIQLISVDTKTDLAHVGEAAGGVIAKGPAAGLGFGDSDYAFRAGAVFETQGIPFVTSGATDPTLPERLGLRVFMTAFGDDDQAAAAADFTFKDLRAGNVAIWANNSTDYTRVLSKLFKRRME
ncbi:MAG: ABC transporter substrate-binding protein, partial [Pseudomonadota bacterium]